MTRAFRVVTTQDDDGVTLIEMVVSLTIMAVMMTIFTTGILQMYQSANKNESLSSAQSELNTVFLRLDKIVRYASWISDVQADAQLYTIKLVATVPSPSASASTDTSAQRCYGFKLNGVRDRLWTTSWNPDSTPSAAPTAAQWSAEPPTDAALQAGTKNTTIWLELADNIDAPAGTKPFERVPADAVQNFDRLQLNLEATTGSGVSGTKTNTNVRFTALNTSLARPTTDLCPLR